MTAYQLLDVLLWANKHIVSDFAWFISIESQIHDADFAVRLLCLRFVVATFAEKGYESGEFIKIKLIKWKNFSRNYLLSECEAMEHLMIT